MRIEHSFTINGFLFGIYKEKANIEDYKKIRQIYGSEEVLI